LQLPIETGARSELTKNIFVRSAQWKAIAPSQQASHIVQGFVRGKLKNYRNALLRGQREGLDLDFQKALTQLEQVIAPIETTTAIDSLRGLEGAGSAAYFGSFDRLIRASEFKLALSTELCNSKLNDKHFLNLEPFETIQNVRCEHLHTKNDRAFKFEARRRRPSTDPVNALLSLGYALLRHDLQSAVNLVGFDPYLGYLHTLRYGRPSLALDLMEEFRPLIVDAVVLSGLNRRTIVLTDFITEPLSGAVSLTPEGLRTFLRLYEQKKQAKFKHPVLQTQCTYQESFEIQARLLAKYLMEETDKYPPLVLK